jgi:hypothetical protein
MAASIEDFVKRLLRGDKKFTFMFTEDFFNIEGKYGVLTDRYKDIRNTIKSVGHRKGTRAEERAGEGVVIFNVEVVVIRTNYSCFKTTFDELAEKAFSAAAIIPGLGGEVVDQQKAKFLVDSFFSEKLEEAMSVTAMIAEAKKRKMVLVVEKPADLKRPSLEPILKLRTQLSKILIHPARGPVVDCQVGKIFQEGNSSSLSSLLSNFCAHY